jgi:hypothetical protein
MQIQKNLHNKYYAPFFQITLIILTVVLGVETALGDIMVQPMMMNLAVRSGQTVTREIELQNTSAERTEIADLRVLELSQDENGTWIEIEPGPEVPLKTSSCREWINLSKETAEVRPLSITRVEVTLRIPPGSRGFYGASIIAQSRPGARVGITISVRYVVPILVEISDRPQRHNVELKDVNLEFHQESELGPATTIATMRITNEGSTASDLKAYARIRTYSGGHWRMITIAEFEDVTIIPGVELRLKSDISRSLPSGTYDVSGALFVDGRRVKPIDKEVEYAGDPTVKTVATDAELHLDPREVIVEALPGATRTSVLKVTNFSDETVNIKTELVMPAVFRGVSIGDLTGMDLYCSEWISIEPNEFTIVSGGRQNIRIVTRMPNPGSEQPWYYTQLTLQATYTDGQNAGKKDTFICVANKNTSAEPVVQPGRLNIAVTEGSKYVVVARFANFGKIHYTPKCRGVITTPGGGFVREITFSGKSGLMIPFESRDFAGIVDFSDIGPGLYRLSSILEYAAERSVNNDVPIRVSGEGEQKIVQVIRPEEFEQTIGVKWQ